MLEKVYLKKEDFQSGIYLCKGSHRNMWWWIAHLGFTSQTLHGTSKDIYPRIFSASPFEDQEFLVVFPKDKTIRVPTDTQPEGQIVLIVLSDYDGTMPSRGSKAYKKYGGVGGIKQIDWDKIEDWKVAMSKLYPGHQDIVDRIYSPAMIKFAIHNKDLAFQTYTPDKKRVRELISLLGSKESITEYSLLEKKDLYSIFLNPNRDQSVLYQILVTGGRYRSFGMCSELWHYFDLYTRVNLKRYRYEPQLLMKGFVYWMYYTNNVWNTKDHPGFISYRNKKGYKSYAFKPSIKAISCLI